MVGVSIDIQHYQNPKNKKIIDIVRVKHRSPGPKHVGLEDKSQQINQQMRAAEDSLSVNMRKALEKANQERIKLKKSTSEYEGITKIAMAASRSQAAVTKGILTDNHKNFVREPDPTPPSKKKLNLADLISIVPDDEPGRKQGLKEAKAVIDRIGKNQFNQNFKSETTSTFNILNDDGTTIEKSYRVEDDKIINSVKNMDNIIQNFNMPSLPKLPALPKTSKYHEVAKVINSAAPDNQLVEFNKTTRVFDPMADDFQQIQKDMEEMREDMSNVFGSFGSTRKSERKKK